MAQSQIQANIQSMQDEMVNFFNNHIFNMSNEQVQRMENMMKQHITRMETIHCKSMLFSPYSLYPAPFQIPMPFQPKPTTTQQQ
eukprot:8617175-Ditylum_brightwellii.AAC.1